DSGLPSRTSSNTPTTTNAILHITNVLPTSKITHLSIDVDVQDSFALTFSRHIAKSHTLQSLHIPPHPNLYPDLIPLFASLPLMPNLHTLSVGWPSWPPAHGLSLAQRLTEQLPSSHINHLTLHSLDTKSLDLIAPCIPLTRLRTLSINGGSCSDETLAKVGRSIASCPSPGLDSLHLLHLNCITDTGTTEFIEHSLTSAAQVGTGVRRLEIAGCEYLTERKTGMALATLHGVHPFRWLRFTVRDVKFRYSVGGSVGKSGKDGLPERTYTQATIARLVRGGMEGTKRKSVMHKMFGWKTSKGKIDLGFLKEEAVAE
ncbi:hypothetical protein HK102_007746, partial [Quaeritorhiza haematococci]